MSSSIVLRLRRTLFSKRVLDMWEAHTDQSIEQNGKDAPKPPHGHQAPHETPASGRVGRIRIRVVRNSIAVTGRTGTLAQNLSTQIIVRRDRSLIFQQECHHRSIAPFTQELKMLTRAKSIERWLKIRLTSRIRLTTTKPRTSRLFTRRVEVYF